MLGHMVYFEGTNSRWESGEMLDEVFCSPCFVSHVDYVTVKCRSNLNIWCEGRFWNLVSMSDLKE